jgi:hypothetical protein
MENTVEEAEVVPFSKGLHREKWDKFEYVGCC